MAAAVSNCRHSFFAPMPRILGSVCLFAVLGGSPGIVAASPLVAAIDRGDVDAVRALVAQGADPNLAAADGRNAWFAALLHPDQAFVVALADGEAAVMDTTLSPSVMDLLAALRDAGLAGERLALLYAFPDVIQALQASGSAALAVLLEGADDTAAEQLLSSGLLDAQGLEFDTLARLLRPDRENLLLTALAAGADIDARSAEDESLLHRAVVEEASSAVQVLLELGAYPDAGAAVFSPLAQAIASGQTGVALYLLEHGANPNRRIEGISAVDLAELVLDVEVLRVLSETTPTPSASVARQVAYALEQLGGANVSAEAWTDELTAAVLAFQQAAGLPEHGHPSVSTLQTLQGRLAGRFLRAVSRGEVATVMAALDHFPGLIDAADAQGWTALLHASHGARAELVRLLLVRGADVETVDARGSNALLLAVIGSAAPEAKLATIRSLRAAGVDAGRSNDDGVSAATIAAGRGGPLAAALVEGS